MRDFPIVQEQGPTLARQPALDGVRGIAVAMVLLFHLGIDWMPAGYLGVSVFFTLSGYLITTLLVSEAERDGRVSFRRFYSRRARRLLPASLLCIVVIAVLRWIGEFEYVAGLRSELVGAVTQVFNWVQLSGSSSYGALFRTSPSLTSPLEHFWSLAIEEQFYVLWPVTLLVLWRRRRGRLVAPLAALAIAAAVAAPLIGLVWGGDAAYWSTPARLGELLVGALVAVWLPGRTVHAWARWLAPLALAAIVVCAVTFPSSGGPAFTGWLTPFALLTGALIVGIQVPGRVRDAMSWAPLVWLGTVSYGLYLFHWPVFVLLRTHGWRIDELPGAIGAVAISLAIAAASHAVVERPIRVATWSAGRTGLMATTAIAVALVVALVAPGGSNLLGEGGSSASVSFGTFDPTETLARATTLPPSTAVNGSTETTIDSIGPLELPLPPTPNRPVRIMVVGDSTALAVGTGLFSWADSHPEHALVDIVWCQGCGFILDGHIDAYDAANDFQTRSAQVLSDDLPKRMAAMQPDIVVLMSTIDDVLSREWNPAEGSLAPTDPRFRARMEAAYRRITEQVLAAGAPTVAWVVPPVPTSTFEAAELNDPARFEAQHAVIRDVVASTAAGAVMCDLDAWMEKSGRAADEGWRPDGTHLADTAASTLAEGWLGPWLVNVATGVAA